MVGYLEILQASGDVCDEDFDVEKEVLVESFLTNPLGPLFSFLSNSRISGSAEAIELVQSKSRSISPKKVGSPKKKARVSKHNNKNEPPSPHQPTTFSIRITCHWYPQ
jgi:hypothetical protein